MVARNTAESVAFDYSAVCADEPADELLDELPAANLTRPQAASVAALIAKRIAAAEATERAHVMARVIGGLLATRNVPMDVNALAIVAGLDQACALGSEADVARRLNVTRAAVSKCVQKWRDTLGYAVNKFARTEDNRLACSQAQLRNHWRNRKGNAARNSD